MATRRPVWEQYRSGEQTGTGLGRWPRGPWPRSRWTPVRVTLRVVRDLGLTLGGVIVAVLTYGYVVFAGIAGLYVISVLPPGLMGVWPLNLLLAVVAWLSAVAVVIAVPAVLASKVVGTGRSTVGRVRERRPRRSEPPLDDADPKLRP